MVEIVGVAVGAAAATSVRMAATVAAVSTVGWAVAPGGRTSLPGADVRTVAFLAVAEVTG
jgi:hypothetical protein